MFCHESQKQSTSLRLHVEHAPHTQDNPASLQLAIGAVKGFLTSLMTSGFYSAGTPRGLHFNDVRTSLKSIKGVTAIHNLRIWSLTTTKIALSVHLALGEYRKRLGLCSTVFWRNDDESNTHFFSRLILYHLNHYGDQDCSRYRLWVREQNVCSFCVVVFWLCLVSFPGLTK